MNDDNNVDVWTLPIVTSYPYHSNEGRKILDNNYNRVSCVVTHMF